MDTFFNPRGVAVVGASTKNLGHHVVLNLVNGFQGGIYPINSNYNEIEGLTCYAAVTEIDGPVDLAIVIVPAGAVPGVLEACAAKGILHVIIESAGFSETGPEGIALQARCDTIARAAGMRLWGPNCMGLVDLPNQRFFTFMHPAIRREGLLPGRISLIVQSGMMSAIFLAELGRRGIGVAKACSIGNRTDVDECDILEYLLQDEQTDVVALYLESMPRGRRFARMARQAAKPIVLLNGGQSRAGATAAMSHTYSLAGNARLLNSVLVQAGVTMAEGIFQMMDMAHTLSMIPHMNPAGRTAILTLSGGAGILMCDALEINGIPIADLSEETRRKVGEIFPPWMPVANPIDLFPAVARNGRRVAFQGAFSGALADPGVDALVIHFVAGLEADMPDFQDLQARARKDGKVLMFWLMGRREGSRTFRDKARAAGIPVHDDALRIGQCLRAVARYQAHRQSAPGADTPPAQITAAPSLPIHQPGIWDEYDSKMLLATHHIPVVTEFLTDSSAEAAILARRIGYPVVLKGLAPGEAHKSERGLVRLNIGAPHDLDRAYTELRDKVGDRGRVLIQQQVTGDYELIAGFLRDPQFGPCVMFGLGGILAELEPDVVFELAPLDNQAAVQLIRAIRNRRLLTGFRGKPPLDEVAMADLLVRLGDIGTRCPSISQIDINPLLITKGTPVAVDATVIMEGA
nr:acetate--CoA ligase family protein [Desulfatitalea alkaliphila]